MTADPNGSKGRDTRRALENAARELFAVKGFHATTIIDITSFAGRSPAIFYRYFRGKQHLLVTLAESFIDDVLIPLEKLVRLPESAEDTEPFSFMVASYWQVFKPQMGVLAAVAQLSATEPVFAEIQKRQRQFSIEVVTATIVSSRATRLRW